MFQILDFVLCFSDSVVSNISSNLPTPSSSTGPCDRPVETTSSPSSSSLSSPVSNINETVRELVTTDWSDDPEMIAGASFEAAVELRAQFPNFQMPSKVCINTVFQCSMS